MWRHYGAVLTVKGLYYVPLTLFCNICTALAFLVTNIAVVTRKKERMQKMALSLPHTFAFSCLPRGFWPFI